MSVCDYECVYECVCVCVYECVCECVTQPHKITAVTNCYVPMTVRAGSGSSGGPLAPDGSTIAGIPRASFVPMD